MYTRAGKAVIFATLLGFMVADTIALSGMCPATPPPSRGGIVAGISGQLVALAAVSLCLQYFNWTYRPQRPADMMGRIRIVVMAGVFCALSVSLFSQSVLFSDTLTMRGKTSAGAACFTDRPVPTVVARQLRGISITIFGRGI